MIQNRPERPPCPLSPLYCYSKIKGTSPTRQPSSFIVGVTATAVAATVSPKAKDRWARSSNGSPRSLTTMVAASSGRSQLARVLHLTTGPPEEARGGQSQLAKDHGIEVWQVVLVGLVFCGAGIRTQDPVQAKHVVLPRSRTPVPCTVFQSPKPIFPSKYFFFLFLHTAGVWLLW